MTREPPSIQEPIARFRVRTNVPATIVGGMEKYLAEYGSGTSVVANENGATTIHVYDPQDRELIQHIFVDLIEA